MTSWLTRRTASSGDDGTNPQPPCRSPPGYLVLRPNRASSRLSLSEPENMRKSQESAERLPEERSDTGHPCSGPPFVSSLPSLERMTDSRREAGSGRPLPPGSTRPWRSVARRTLTARVRTVIGAPSPHLQGRAVIPQPDTLPCVGAGEASRRWGRNEQRTRPRNQWSSSGAGHRFRWVMPTVIARAS